MSGAPDSFVPAPERSADLRRAFGCYGTGVTIITTELEDGPLGMTANSFSSVSLDPALVLWCPARSSRRHDAFVTAKRFCIHVLNAEQLHVAKHFAGQGDGFSASDWAPGARGTPELRGCLAEFHCETHAVHPAGDHSLVLGLVTRVCLHNPDAPGLLFDRGRFGHFSDHRPAGQ
ncbi:flavin reductase family protein [uncultured Roseobacter sp.]|uniref:flavin reductase family protein n=1 Tax=uncultured Roseobacter sp. TaxID=114847 RepID=UPI0026373E3E|nr:flavin reductase family protein [uncultured Roseobacter sp.]